MLDLKDIGNIYSLIERVEVTGKEVDGIYKLKLKIIDLMKKMTVGGQAQPTENAVQSPVESVTTPVAETV